jgi:hypothetical protein
MKKFLLHSIIVLTLLSLPNLTFGQVLNLGTLTDFSAYSGTGAVSNTGTSVLEGTIGSNNGAVTGFGLPTTAGTVYIGDATTAQAKIDLLRVYIHLSNLFITNNTHSAAFGNGEIITAGVYSIAGAGSLAGSITLDGQGNTNAAFIIKFEGAFTAAAGSKIILANGARASNVFWMSNGAISIGASSTAKGNLIAFPGAITVAADSTLEGRMLSSEGAVTFGPGEASLPIGSTTIAVSCDNTCDNSILGTVANFALFTSSGAVANTATSGIVGDIGSNGGAISGFASSTVAGSFYNTDAVTAQAKIDLQAAYDHLRSIETTNTTHAPAFGSGETLSAGVYHVASAGSLAGTITLDAQGDPDAFFLFKFTGAFSTAAQSKVILTNGASHCNVFWLAEGAISMGTFTHMKGTLIANNGANAMGANGNLQGRMLSTVGAIGFSTGIIYNSTFCLADPIAIIEAVNDTAIINGNTGGVSELLTNNDTLNGNLVTLGTATGNVTMTTGPMPTGITIDSTTGIVTVAPNTAAGIYLIKYTICEGALAVNCSTTTATITVFAPATVPTAITGTTTICTGTSTILTATGGTTSTSSSYQWGTGSVIGTNIISRENSASIAVSPISDTVYWVRRVDSAADNITGGVTQMVGVTVSSVGGLTSAKQDACAGISVLEIVLTGNVGRVVKWQKSNDAAFTTPTDIATTSTILSSSTIGLLFTETFYRAVVSNGTCSSAFSSVSRIVVAPASFGGTMHGSTRIFSGSDATLILSSRVGSILKWQSSIASDFSSNVSDIANTTQSFTTPSLTTTTYYRAVVQNGTCSSAYSSIAEIKINPISIRDSQCGTILINLDSSIYPNTVPGAQAYKYQVTNGINVRVYEPTTTALFNLTQLPGGVTYNVTYTVQVAVKIKGVWSGFGTTCAIRTPSPVTKVKAANCGRTLATIHTSVYADALIAVQGYRFEVTDPTNNVRTFDATTNLFNLTQLTDGAAFNTTYSIRVAAQVNGVWGAYGGSCSITTPRITPTKVKDSQCGSTLSALNSSIYYIMVYDAEAYRFEVTKGNSVVNYDVTNTTNLFNLTQLVGGAEYATIYSIRVAAMVKDTWSDFGQACTVTTPEPITKVKAQYCGTTLATLNTSIYADALIGVQGYRFEVTNGANTRTFNSPSNLFNLSQLTAGALHGTTYMIRVAANVNGVWGAYGASCNVATPVKIIDQQIAKTSNQKLEEISDSIANVEYTVKAYPNPFFDNFKLLLTSASEKTVEVVVYDLLGRMITSKTVKAADINTVELGNEYTAGVYNVIIRQGNDFETLRMIKR